MILDKFLNESTFGLMGNHEPTECPLSESVLITPDSLGVENAKAMDERDAMRLEKAVLYAESVIFVKQAQGADTEVLSENVVTDFFKKMYEMIKRAWGRMVEWFKNLFKAIELSIRDMKKALEGVEGKLNAKDMTKFKYFEHSWKSTNIHDTLAKNAETRIASAAKDINDDLAEMKKLVRSDTNKIRDKYEETEKGYKAEDNAQNLRIGEVMGTNSELTMEEAKDKIKEAYGSDISADEKTGLDMGHANEMIKFLKDFQKNKVLTEAKSKVDKNYKSTLDKVKDVESKITVNKNNVKDTATNKKNSDAKHNMLIAHVKRLLNDMASYNSIYDSLMGCCMDQEKAKFKEYKGIIIAAVRYSPKKEN